MWSGNECPLSGRLASSPWVHLPGREVTRCGSFRFVSVHHVGAWPGLCQPMTCCQTKSADGKGWPRPACGQCQPSTHSTSSSPGDTVFSQPAVPTTPCSLGRGAVPSGTVLPKKRSSGQTGPQMEHYPALASRLLSATNDTSHRCNFCSYCVSFPKKRNSSWLRGSLSQTQERNYLLLPQSTHASHSLLTLSACLGMRAHTRVHAHILVQPSHAQSRTHVQTHSCTHTLTCPFNLETIFRENIGAVLF